MIGLLRALGLLRAIDAQLEAARGERTQIEEGLRKEIRAHEDTQEKLHSAILATEQERTRRIAAETVASERREEIGRLQEQCRELREDLRSVNAERLKSLDSLNTRLMRESAPEPAPDLEKFRREQVAEVSRNLVRAARETHRKADYALLSKLHPQFRNLRPMNETVQPASEETAA